MTHGMVAAQSGTPKAWFRDRESGEVVYLAPLASTEGESLPGSDRRRPDPNAVRVVTSDGTRFYPHSVFLIKFQRCLADGSIICALTDEPGRQAIWLHAANKYAESRLEALDAVSWWGRLLGRHRFAERDTVIGMIDDVTAHIADLRRNYAKDSCQPGAAQAAVGPH